MTRTPSRGTLTATRQFQQPEDRPGRFRPGDRVRFIGGTCTFEVLDSDGVLVRLLSETGAECRAGWRVLERVREVTTP